MAVSLADSEAVEEQETLALIEKVTCKQRGLPRTLAVCKRGNGEQVLCWQRERGKPTLVDGKPTGKRSRDNGIERDWRTTSRLADIASAIKAGLIA